MASYLLSRRAQADIDRIARVSTDEWGLAQARTYVEALHTACQNLADFPHLGRNAAYIRPGMLRLESGSHVIFYRRAEGGIVVLRILHERMDFLRHLQ